MSHLMSVVGVDARFFSVSVNFSPKLCFIPDIFSSSLVDEIYRLIFILYNKLCHLCLVMRMQIRIGPIHCLIYTFRGRAGNKRKWPKLCIWHNDTSRLNFWLHRDTIVDQIHRKKEIDKEGEKKGGLTVEYACSQIQHFISFSSKPILFYSSSKIGLLSSC